MIDPFSVLVPSKAFEEHLSTKSLTNLVRVFADQRQERTCSGLFQTSALPIKPAGEVATWDEVRFSRHLAPVVGRDGPHPRAALLAPRKLQCAMASIKVMKDLPVPHLFFDVAASESAVEHGLRVLMEELQDLANLIANTREWLAAHALQGRIEVSEHTLPGSEIAFTIEFGTGRADAVSSWADELTRVRSHELIVLQRRFKGQAGVSPGVVLAGADVEGYLIKNLDVRGLAVARLGPAILRGKDKDGKNPWDGLGGLSWRFMDGAFRPEGGPVTRYLQKDTLVVLPPAEQLRSVLGWAEGRVFVPKGPLTTTDLRHAVDLIQEQRGAYAYAEVRTDPVGIRIYAGWTGLPVVLNPDAVLVYRVVPAGSTP